jgi:hypothetical protein
MPGLTQHLHGLWYVSEHEYIDAKFSSTLVEYSIVRCRAMRCPSAFLYMDVGASTALFSNQQRPTVRVSLSRFVTILRVSLPLAFSLSSFFHLPGAGLLVSQTLTVPKSSYT